MREQRRDELVVEPHVVVHDDHHVLVTSGDDVVQREQEVVARRDDDLDVGKMLPGEGEARVGAAVVDEDDRARHAGAGRGAAERGQAILQMRHAVVVEDQHADRRRSRHVGQSASNRASTGANARSKLKYSS